jgi:ubiquinone biosynthesis protein COQ9
MNTPERSPERDAAVDAVLPLVERQGWCMATLRQAMSAQGAEPLDAELLFPGGTPDLIEAFVDLTDRRMEAAAEAAGVAELRVSARVRALIALRLQLTRPHKDAVRRSLAILSLPRNAALATRTLARTVDSVWHAAGDRSADFSWYTKRGLLAGVYSATILFWLRDHSDDDAETLAFLDRRLANVAAIGRLRRRLDGVMARFRPVGTAA